MSSSRGQSTSTGPIVRCGHLRKSGSLISGLKPLKKKYFVLRGDSPGHPACLEYYDNKKKFDNKQQPKRTITMKSCYNINRRNDTKHKHVIALYTKDGCFSLILDSDKDVDDWLTAMLLLSGDVPDGELPRPTFEHVWEVTLQKKGLAERMNINGSYRLCLTDHSLSLIKAGDKKSDCLEFLLTTVRRCGSMERYFYMEVGRSAVTGEGEYWMKVEDANIALNMHTAILNAMSSNASNRDKEDSASLSAKTRMRSFSANEASKPISVLGVRRPTSKLHGFSPLGTGRDRCDSLPSRARTTSEGLPTPLLPHPRTSHLTPHPTRPHSMYTRGLSYSPPVSSMPISPASNACSTDSAGSSLSMDDQTDIMDESVIAGRYGHSLTPDEPVILEENMDDYAHWSTSSHLQQKYSPNFKSHSSSQQSSYVEMHSPCGSSPGRGTLGPGPGVVQNNMAGNGPNSGIYCPNSGTYLPMSPGTAVHSHSHSRASSLIEEATLPDGYVPMAPVGDDEYVDMDPANQNGHSYHDDMMSQHGSSCSVTSGTPSTDLRFSEYPLDKVASYLTPSEEDPTRPTRAYSVGSRPDPANRHRKNRIDIAVQEANRVRAFSVGSRSKRPELGRLAANIHARLPTTDGTANSKSNSAPLLSSSWGHVSGCSVNLDRMEDLMEMDFSRNVPPTTLSSTPSSCSHSHSHSHSYSTATDNSSYMDMSPGQPHPSVNAPYVDMSGISKINRNNNNYSNLNNNNNNNNNYNNNNNNNNTTANHNHNTMHTSTITMMHKPIIKTLKPVVEAVGPFVRMEESLEELLPRNISPKQNQQVSSPMQEDYMQMNGPPGVMRTAPVDFPQPRKPPEGYVEMNFKARPTMEQNYINMTMGSGLRTRRRSRPSNHRKEKSQRSQPIAIMSNKPAQAPSFLPLNGSSTSESCASTPASTDDATPTSSATIFPFSLNSPQSPVKPFGRSSGNDNDDNNEDDKTKSMTTSSECSPDGDYALMTPGTVPPTATTTTSIPTNSSSSATSATSADSENKERPGSPIQLNPAKTEPLSPLSKRLTELSVSKNRSSPQTVSSFGTSSIKDLTDKSETKSLKREREDKPPSPVNRDKSTELPQSPVAKKLSELTVSKVKISNSPNASPTPCNASSKTSVLITSSSSSSLKATSPKNPDDTTPTLTPTATPTPTPSPLDSEGYEKLQPGASLLHYASLDLPESNGPPVSPTPVQDGFRYAEIDFAKLRQN
ncbi:insulin receptor substrate 1 chico isoform X4 [Cotesia typhae]|uniref:insulin receptor substrate 1 chico isoform X4 n=1 Tax=Cotesia typhae TaxID=2053667 RepID=UPI003D690533